MDGPTGILISGGKVVNEDVSLMGDVYIENGRIAAVGRDLNVPAGVQVIDASGMLVMPGGIDTHTHMEFSFMGTTAVDDFYIGTKVTNPQPLGVCVEQGRSQQDSLKGFSHKLYIYI